MWHYPATHIVDAAAWSDGVVRALHRMGLPNAVPDAGHPIANLGLCICKYPSPQFTPRKVVTLRVLLVYYSQFKSTGST